MSWLFIISSSMDREDIRKYCTSLKAVTEDIKWGNDLCFTIGGKMFCVMYLGPEFSLSFKVNDDVFDELTDREHIIPAPYMARNKWIQVKNPAVFNATEWKSYLLNAYRLISAKLTKKQKLELGL